MDAWRALFDGAWREFFDDTPDVLLKLVLSYIPHSEIWRADTVKPLIFCSSTEYYLEKPRALFAQSVHATRILSCPHLGIVYHSYRALKELSRGDLSDAPEYYAKVNDLLASRFKKTFSLSGHTMCEAGFVFLITGRWEDLGSDQFRYIQDHFASDWIPCMNTVLANTERRDFDIQGCGLVIARMCMALVKHDETRAEIKEMAVRYVADSSAVSPIFSDSVLSMYRTDFLEIEAFSNQFS